MSALFMLLIIFILLFRERIFTEPASTILFDKNGKLLGARIADDDQWRFPYNDTVPHKFEVALIEFEDRHFYQHFGVNPFSLIRATYQNIKSKEIISGGSTLSMQVIRLSRKGKKRTVLEKIKEIFLSIRMELFLSKEKILSYYASNAPFGGNVVGLDAAAWRYFGRSSNELSWAESATLAVLPNAPSLIYPGKNHEILLKKRNNLLKNLLERSFIDSITYELSIWEELPEKPKPLPNHAYHLLSKAEKDYKGKSVETTIDFDLQQRVNKIIELHNKHLRQNMIFNAAAIVVEVESGEILSYVGNAGKLQTTEHAQNVDIIQSNRSSGSILKPILFACMIHQGEILQNSLIPDIPMQLGGHSPRNFSLTYDGAVPASQSLSRSLNIPALKLLQQYGYPRFYQKLKSLGITSLQNNADHYGLSLILGGAEVKLWDLTGIYSSLSRILNHFANYSGKYDNNDIHPPIVFKDNSQTKEPQWTATPLLSAASIWLTYEALINVNRPADFSSWESFSSSNKVAWKTGTSFGFRDAWAIGTTPKYVVGVWVGNADGEGRSGLTGSTAAAPIMFEIINALPKSDWFNPPYDELTEVNVCSKSGYKASQYCEESETILVHRMGVNSPLCPYHKIVNLNKEGTFQVNSECETIKNMQTRSWFVLPPVMEWYYKPSHPEYHTLPPVREDCMGEDHLAAMEFIYPQKTNTFYVPVGLSGEQEEIIFEVAHRRHNAIIYWHLDNEFIGITENSHKLSINTELGKHQLVLVDDEGNVLKKWINILSELDTN